MKTLRDIIRGEIQVVSVVTPVCASIQLTRYQGGRRALLRTGIARPQWFEVGKSGTRRVHDLKLPHEQRYEIKAMARGQWRVTRFHIPGRPPYIPSKQDYVRTQFDYEASIHAAYSERIESHHAEIDGRMMTYYIGSREQLIQSGLATPSQFPPKGSSARARKWSSPEQGDWALNRLADGRWEIGYANGGFEMTPELRRDADLADLYAALRDHFGDGPTQPSSRRTR